MYSVPRMAPPPHPLPSAFVPFRSSRSGRPVRAGRATTFWWAGVRSLHATEERSVPLNLLVNRNNNRCLITSAYVLTLFYLRTARVKGRAVRRGWRAPGAVVVVVVACKPRRRPLSEVAEHAALACPHACSSVLGSPRRLDGSAVKLNQIDTQTYVVRPPPSFR